MDAFNNFTTKGIKRGLLRWRSHEKGWVLGFQRVKDRFVLPTFWSEYSDQNVGKTNLSFTRWNPRTQPFSLLRDRQYHTQLIKDHSEWVCLGVG